MRIFGRSVKPKLMASLASGLMMLGAAGSSNATIITGGITGGSALAEGGSFIYVNPIPVGFTVGNDNFQDFNVRGFDEDQNIVLATALSVDVGSNIAAGIEVASHSIVFDPAQIEDVFGFIEFDSDVLGIITTLSKLAASDSLANTDVAYLNPNARGLEADDSVSIDANNARRINFHFRASSPGDTIRVLTAHSPGAVPVSEPASSLLIGAGILSLMSVRRRLKA